MSDTTTQKLPAHAKLASLVKGKRIGMLTTCLANGELDAKPMSLLELDDEGHFWFFVEHAPEDRGAHERYRVVNLSFSDEGESTFVSIAGSGELLHDRERIEALWTPMAKPWFPDGPDSPRLALLKITPERSEYWDAPESRIVRGVALAASMAAGKPIGMGEHGVISSPDAGYRSR
jgi:general stress protein 26